MPSLAVGESRSAPQIPPPLPLPEVAEPVSRWFWPTMAGIAFAGLIAIGVVLQLQRHSGSAEVASDKGAQPATTPTTAEQVARDHAGSAVVSAVKQPADGKPPAVSKVEPPAPNKSPATVQVAAVDPPAPNKTAPAAVSKVDPPAISNAEPPAVSKVEPPKSADTAPPAPAVPANPPPNSTPRPAPQAAAAHPSVERLPPRDVDVEARLADQLPEVELQNVPLWRFVNQVSQLSTIPITIDVDELAEMNLSVDSPVSVQAKDATVSGVLDEALTPHGLAPRVVKDQLIIGRAASVGLRRVRYAVGDLVGEKPDAQQQDRFAKLVHALVAPASWKEGGGEGTSVWSDGALVVEQTESAHAQMLVLCEKLRVARSLPLRSKLAAERFRLEPRAERAKAALSAPVTANFGRPEPLPHILAYLGEAAHVRLLIDHASLADEQMSGETEAYVTVQKLSLGQALAALLEPLELTYRVIDERTIEITTPRAAARRAELEFYSVAHTPGSESELIASVRQELATAGISASLLDGIAIRYDAPGHALLVRAPQSVQVQVQAALGSLRIARQ